MDTFLWLTLILLLVIAITLFYLYRFLSVNYLNPLGKGAAKKTARKLQGFARLHLGRVLSGVKLGEDVPEIENLLIGPFGVLLVHTCGARGEYYGKVDSDSWTLMPQGKEGPRRTFPNPLREQERAIAALRELFAKNKVFKVPVEQVVYISSRAKKTAVFITNDGRILPGGALGKFLAKERFEQDKGVDVPRVEQVISSARG